MIGFQARNVAAIDRPLSSCKRSGVDHAGRRMREVVVESVELLKEEGNK